MVQPVGGGGGGGEKQRTSARAETVFTKSDKRLDLSGINLEERLFAATCRDVDGEGGDALFPHTSAAARRAATCTMWRWSLAPPVVNPPPAPNRRTASQLLMRRWPPNFATSEMETAFITENGVRLFLAVRRRASRAGRQVEIMDSMHRGRFNLIDLNASPARFPQCALDPICITHE